MPRLRVTVSVCVVVLAGATVMALWMSAWPRMHDRATEAAVIARGARDAKAPPPPAPHRRVRATPSAPSPAPVQAAAAPAPLDAPSPPYPMAALRKQAGGVVILRVGVDGAGHVTAVDVAESSGHPLLDDSARRTMRRWRFEPPAGHRPMHFDYPVRFRVGDP